MNKNIAIRAENISKQYRLGEVGTGTISHDLNRFWAKMRRKEDPFLKIGESNDRSQKGGSEYVWSLKDINFEIEKGDAVGIIGRNGAGKSTLLKLLSRVTKPTTGHFDVDGRIASLLEVGTGFNPEMTGRENIFLNGAILGMRKHEIKKKFDEIVDFSGVERYIDTPVKRYSSGMYVRLAFAVAAHLESEILIVDEVLAVGDAEFQKKCLGKMGDVSKGEGRTVLFVSHNMTSIQNLCNKALLLENGNIHYTGSCEIAVQKYLRQNTISQNFSEAKNRKGNGIIKIQNVKVYGKNTETKPQSGEKFSLEFEIDNPQQLDCSEIIFDLRIDDYLGNRLIWLSSSLKPNLKKQKFDSVQFNIDRLPLNEGEYFVTTHISARKELADWIQNAFSFEVDEGDFYKSGKKTPFDQSKILIDFDINYD